MTFNRLYLCVEPRNLSMAYQSHKGRHFPSNNIIYDPSPRPVVYFGHYPKNIFYFGHYTPPYIPLAAPINVSRYCPKCRVVYLEPWHYLPLSANQGLGRSSVTCKRVPCRDLFHNRICLYVSK